MRNPRDRGNWRGLPQGWHDSLENDTPSLRSPTEPAPAVTTEACPPPFTIPKTGLPIQLPVNNFPPITAQTLGLSTILTLGAGVTENVFSFEVPTNYNGWILSLVLGSANNAANPGQVTYTSFNPAINGQRIWPFIVSSTDGVTFTPNIIPGTVADVYTAPIQIQNNNLITIQAVNGWGTPDVIFVKILGWIDQNYVPNQAANRSG